MIKTDQADCLGSGHGLQGTQQQQRNNADSRPGERPGLPSLPRVGNGYDVHALAQGLPFMLGGIKLDHTKGCIAHSDGDCLLHALCDALLGALAMGDIGSHFPDTSEEYKGIDSRILLERTYAMVRKARYYLGNADCTVCLQAPRIAKYIPRMKEVLAGILDVAPECISIKATTTEHLGFVGREEGIAVYATVLLWPEV
ncbi:MAG TPA: 2-C-methyl-D-erythritol 2,4-cyclodiphosphate synthase [Bacteroidales bacterium]|jgi:2-C-methyl-D-erythritol 2,4-cyclodiphosphate synthase|nr:Bifunctional enzyme IspD/IspF [Bacteroidales bacterium]OQC56705.1 MAG: 2-C-methyl-D-erythritol 2,4-cyclodiphosphate synthase [Bacteroidetes bacterium ADurb.Bin013]NLZ08637.1 2-C-methyl-D-erythritol 2,4-cyclodiphosphate synthase [Bacteroidales bacterium]HNR27406.1 2-C-methyl-D-erythritol 2,4-cyclodiphosphate synthase [Bacteroidales bacterium]HNT48707.1 2-C-methyl-D-erythritol 2,4-cyclodiphosphate synthase [Bacteroidales bacterium]